MNKARFHSVLGSKKVVSILLSATLIANQMLGYVAPAYADTAAQTTASTEIASEPAQMSDPSEDTPAATDTMAGETSKPDHAATDGSGSSLAEMLASDAGISSSSPSTPQGTSPTDDRAPSGNPTTSYVAEVEADDDTDFVSYDAYRAALDGEDVTSGFYPATTNLVALAPMANNSAQVWMGNTTCYQTNYVGLFGALRFSGKSGDELNYGVGNLYNKYFTDGSREFFCINEVASFTNGTYTARCNMTDYYGNGKRIDAETARRCALAVQWVNSTRTCSYNDKLSIKQTLIWTILQQGNYMSSSILAGSFGSRGFNNLGDWDSFMSWYGANKDKYNWSATVWTSTSSRQPIVYVTSSPKTGTVTIKKTSSNTSISNISSSIYSLSGATYGIYANNACTNKVATVTTNASGIASATLGYGTYYVKEIAAPSGYNLSDTITTVTLNSGSATANVSDSPKTFYGPLSIKKSSSNPSLTNNNSLYSLQGAVYGVYSNSGCTAEVTRVTTDANGNAKTKNLALGTYYIKEISAPKGFNKSTAVTKAVINSTSGVTVNVTESPMIYGKITLHKTSSNPTLTDNNDIFSLQGAVYGVYSDSACKTLVTKLTTDADGNATSGYLKVGTYYVKEISASKEYTVSTVVSKATISNAGGVTVNVTETPKPYARITLKKTSSDTALTDGSPLYSLQGAVYGVYSDSACKTLVTKMTTDADGNATSGYLKVGTYYVKEISASKGYMVSADVSTVDITNTDGVTINVTEEPMTYYGNLTINKTSSNPKLTDSNIEFDLNGAEYGVYSDKECQNLVTTMVLDTNNNGDVQGGVEVEGAEPEIVDKDTSQPIDPSDDTKSMATTSLDPDESQPATDVYYRIDGTTLHLNSSGGDGWTKATAIGQLYDDWKSNTDITKVVIDEPIRPTSCAYMFFDLTSLTEIEGLENLDTSITASMRGMFCLCSSLQSLDLSSFDTSKASDMSSMFSGCHLLRSLDLSNLDTSHVTDMHSMFASCNSLTDIVGLENLGTSHVTDMSWMFGFCFSLASLDLSNLDTSNVTDMSGMFYACESLQSLDLSSFDTSKVTSASNMLYGCPRLATLTTQKAGVDNIALPATMYEKDNYDSPAYTTMPSGSLQLVTTKSTRTTAKATTQLQVGTYYVKEITAPKGFELDDRVYDVEITKSDTTTLDVKDDPLDPPTFIIKKTSAAPDVTDGNPNFDLAGAVYGIYSDESCETLVTETTLDTSTSDKFSIGTTQLEGGDYYVKEITAPQGYAIDDTVYPVTLTRPDTTTLNVADSPEQTLLKIKKSSSQPALTEGNNCYDLTGAEYSIYTDEGCTSKAGTIVIDENGEGSIDFITADGTYYVKETKAPKGFELDEETHKVTLTRGETTTLEVEDVPLDDPVVTRITKSNSLSKVPVEGAEVTVNYYDNLDGDVDGDPKYSWVFQTDRRGILSWDAAHLVSGDLSSIPLADNNAPLFPIGTYTMAETKAPEGYVTPTNSEVKATDGDGMFWSLASNATATTGPTYRLVINDATATAKLDITNTFEYDEFATPDMSTVLTTVDGEKSITPYDATLVDTVTLSGLMAGTTYRLDASLVNQATEKELATASATFVATGEEQEVEVKFDNISATDEMTPYFISGGLATCFETLTRTTDEKGAAIDEQVVAEHKDPSDANQTVAISKISTTAIDPLSGTHEAKPTTTGQISDTIAYENLIVGHKYLVHTELDNNTNGDAYTDPDGKAICKTTTFTPDSENGATEVRLDIDTSDMAGQTIVVKETVVDITGYDGDLDDIATLTAYYTHDDGSLDPSHLVSYEDSQDNSDQQVYVNDTYNLPKTGRDGIRGLCVILSLACLGIAICEARPRRRHE